MTSSTATVDNTTEGLGSEDFGPLGDPLVRESELTENSTYYEALVALPSDETMNQMWLIWSVLLLAIGIYSAIIFLPVAFTKKVRTKPFNLYLIFLMIPDTTGTLLCGANCLANYLAGEFAGGAATCYFQSFYLISWISINAWLNALITRKLLAMLQSSNHFIRYQPPTLLQVTKECLLVYLWCFFVASWGIYGAAWEWWPHHTIFRLACIPGPVDDTSMVFFYVVYFPCLVGIPFCYVLYASFRIWREGLLPPPGRRRTLAIYFFRLAFVFIVMWVPSIILMFVTPAFTNPWVEHVGGTWSHLQVFVSSSVSLMKPDIWEAFIDFYTKCTLLRKEEVDQDMPPSSWISTVPIPGFSDASTHSHVRPFGVTKKPLTLEEEIHSLELIKFQLESESKRKPSSIPMMDYRVGNDEEEDDEDPYKEACRADCGVNKGNNDHASDIESLGSFANE
ncbi:expressed unknown protein [Seminavis robusta]|uniref:Uncharacterized protein n=1 Tax=Seminavis robusta TaxID=568900 RepID=A0A9N8DMA3_9STRA|nr:expressed unknown protein [Seminavis robusta]|eukprot:Sro221_g090861.1  (451) ;mRNA; f:7655-9007